jgi:hypothetical protein
MALLGVVMLCVTSCKEDNEDALRSSECDIVSFTTGGEAWTISGTNITKTFPHGTDVTALAPTITVSDGATVNPASGAAQNFSQDVTYTVTADDGKTKKTYTAKATVAASTEAEITAFATGGEAWSISGTDITKTFPYGTDVTALTPTISVSTGATVNPTGAQDFSQDVTYTVTAADGTTKKTYTAKATIAPSTEAEITAFTTDGGTWTIDGTDITGTFPYGTDVSALTTTITVSEGATVEPASGVQDFSQGAVTYTVTAADGETKQTYTATAIVAASTEAEITAFTAAGGTWTIDGTDITKTFPNGTDVSDLVPIITLSEGATVDPASSTTVDFSKGAVTYTVTAADGTTKKTYTATATVEPPSDSDACDITAFTVNGEAWSISGTTITHTYPAGTTVTALTPIIIASEGATVAPASSVTKDFSQGAVTYTVTAADGTTKKTYTAIATVAPTGASSACEITAFTTDGGTWTIDGTDITKTFPSGTDVTKLAPTITVSPDATVSPASGEEKDFSKGAVTYTVTAADGTTKQTYTATATVEPTETSDLCKIESFTTAGGTWTISGSTITGILPAGTDVTKLAPTITVSDGATVDPASGVTKDFSQDVTYTVTAADGTTKQTYTAKATVVTSNLSDACEITAVTTAGGTWTITGTDIAGTLTAGTDITALAPTITASAGATVSPTSAQDFSKGAVTYTVTAENGTTTKTYTAKATVLVSTEADIKTFTTDGGAWNISGTNITKTFPYGTPQASLTPTIVVSAGATVTPATGVVQDFFTAAGVTYTVTAADGKTTKTYTAKATIAPASTEAKITAFTTGGESWAIVGTDITKTFPYETNVSALAPIIAVSTGAKVDPASGVTKDFSAAAGVLYTVTAESGATQTYTAKAIILPPLSSECDITEFRVTGWPWNIEGTDIFYEYGPNDTEAGMLHDLAADIDVSEGATIDPNPGEYRNYLEGVTYVVTAENGTTTKTYFARAWVTSSEPPEPPELSSECDITRFDVSGVLWTIDEVNKTIYREYNLTDAEAYDHFIAPIIEVSEGASVSPGSGDGQPLHTAEGIAYVVKAADGTEKTYNVRTIIQSPEPPAPSGVLANRTNWTAVSRNGSHAWNDIGDCDRGTWASDCDATAGGGADKVLDGNPYTGWHSNPGEEFELPQAIMIDMKGSKKVKSLVLHHRPDALPAGDHPSWIYFNKIQVYLSDDSYDPNAADLGAYGSGIFTYTWDGSVPATINLPQTTEGQYLMLVFPDSRVSKHISFTELDVYVE